MSDLHIPDVAYEQAGVALSPYEIVENESELDGVVSAVLEAAAPLVVAAELRRIAAYFDSFHRAPGEQYGSALTHVASHLRARADELDGGAS